MKAWMKNGFPILQSNGRAMLSDACCCGVAGYAIYGCDYLCETNTFSEVYLGPGARGGEIWHSDVSAELYSNFLRPDCMAPDGSPTYYYMLLDGSTPEVLPADTWFKGEAGWGAGQHLLYFQTIPSDGVLSSGWVRANMPTPEPPDQIPLCRCKNFVWVYDCDGGGWVSDGEYELRAYWPAPLRYIATDLDRYNVLAMSNPGPPNFSLTCGHEWYAYFDCTTKQWSVSYAGSGVDRALIGWQGANTGHATCVTAHKIQPAAPTETPTCIYYWYSTYDCATQTWSTPERMWVEVGGSAQPWSIYETSAYCATTTNEAPAVPTEQPTCYFSWSTTYNCETQTWSTPTRTGADSYGEVQPWSISGMTATCVTVTSDTPELPEEVPDCA